MVFEKIIGRLKAGRGDGQSGKKVVITSINIKLGVDVHSLGRKELDREVFTLSIPFQNKLGGGILPDNLKGPNMTVSEIKVDQPFELLDVSPVLPVEVGYMSRREFTLRIKAPAMNYEGPMMIRFGTESRDNVSINISRIMLFDGEKKVELESSATDMIIKKSQAFRRDVQLYKILGYGRTVDSIEVVAPFSLVDSDPRVPFKIDRKDSYVATLYIRCPEFNYAGELEIRFR